MSDPISGRTPSDLSVTNLNVNNSLTLQCQRLECILQNLASRPVAQIVATGRVTTTLQQFESVPLLNLAWDDIQVQALDRTVDVILDDTGTINVVLPRGGGAIRGLLLPSSQFFTNLNVIAQGQNDHTIETQILFGAGSTPSSSTMAIKTMTQNNVKTLHGEIVTIQKPTAIKTPGVYTALPSVVLSDLTPPPAVGNLILHRVVMQVGVFAATVNPQITD